MKLLSKAFLFILFISVNMFSAFAQRVYPAAVTKNGILFGKYKTVNDATNPINDTISLNEARNITALCAIHIDKEQKLQNLDVLDFQMTIKDENDTLSHLNNTGLLSDENKGHLEKIKSGSKLIFEGIRAGFSNGDARHVIILVFIVI